MAELDRWFWRGIKLMFLAGNYIDGHNLTPTIQHNLIETIKSNMNLRHYELATIAAASLIKCSAWTVSNGAVLRSKFFGPKQVEAIVRDYHNAGLEPAEVALMAFSEKITLHAYKITHQDIDELRSHGFSDEEILDIVLTVGFRNFISRVMEALGMEPNPEWIDQVKPILGEGLFEALQVGRPLNPTKEGYRDQSDP